MHEGDESSMRIFISFVGGNRFHGSITLEVESTDTIGLVKDKIREQEMMDLLWVVTTSKMVHHFK